MSTKRFSHNGEEWEVETTGTGVGAGASSAGHFPPISRWSVVFRPLKDPAREVRGSIGSSDPNTLDTEQLAKELERALRSKKQH